MPSNQKFNAYLKEIATVCKINKELTFHVARHTFATTVTLTNGVPIETVSKMLGHTKLQTTQIMTNVLHMNAVTFLWACENPLIGAKYEAPISNWETGLVRKNNYQWRYSSY